MNSWRLALMASSAICSGALFALTANAQSDNDTQSDEQVRSLETVTVTAQRREESLQDVGVAVSAFSGAKLEDQSVGLTTEIAKLTPGVTVSGTLGGQGLQFSIRGVTQSDYNDAIEAPVAVYVDDTYISSQQGQGIALFDVERVEVLKGPQGTLFGRNATGGLVHFIVRKPELETYDGFVKATVGNFETQKIDGAINIPIGEKVAIRASGVWNSRGSVWDNRAPEGVVAGAPLNFGPAGVSPSGEDLGDEESIAGRFQLLWEPNSDFSARLTAATFDQDLSASPWASSPQVPVLDAQDRVVNVVRASSTETRAAIGPDGQNYFNPAVLAFQGFLFSPDTPGERAPGASWFGYVPLSVDDLELSKDYALSDLNRFSADNIALHLNGNWSGVDVVSVTSYSKYDKHFTLDADGSPVNGFGFGTLSDMETLSQELRFSGGGDTYNWTAGAYYLDIESNVAQSLLAPRGSALALVFGAADTGIDPLSVFELKTESASVFGQVDWEFAPKWTFVLGGRLIDESQDYDYAAFATANLNDFRVDLGPALFPLYPEFTDSRSDTLWAGKAQIEYRPNEDLLLYAGLNKGVKGGSYNGKLVDGSPPLAPSEIPYEPEELVSFEAGFKFEDAFGRYRINGSYFHYDYTDYQSFVFADVSGFVSNEDMTTNGLEIEAIASLADGLVGSIGAAWTDATVEGFEIAPGVIRDTVPTFTPEYTANARLDYSRTLGSKELSLAAIVSYQSEFYHNARNFDGDLYDGRTLLDLNAQLDLESGVAISAFINNVTDERYNTVGLNLATACGCNLEAYGAPVALPH